MRYGTLWFETEKMWEEVGVYGMCFLCVDGCRLFYIMVPGVAD